MNIKSLAAFATMVLGISGVCVASAEASSAVTLTSDGEYYNGAPYTLGFEFTVSGSQVISALGAFDEGGDGLNGAADVGLWDANGDLLASVVVPAGTGGHAGWRVSLHLDHPLRSYGRNDVFCGRL